MACTGKPRNSYYKRFIQAFKDAEKAAFACCALFVAPGTLTHACSSVCISCRDLRVTPLAARVSNQARADVAAPSSYQHVNSVWSETCKAAGAQARF